MEKQRASNLVILLTIVIAVLFLSPVAKAVQPVGFLFNAVLAGGVGYFFLRGQFLEQFKHFKGKVLLYGIPLTIIVGVLCGSLFQMIAGKPTTNSISETITVTMVFAQVPFMILGEEILSTNLLLALQNKGLSFLQASIVVSLLFAFWHIPAYGFHPVQLLITLAPLRLALNFLWKRSKSVWVSWLCHYLYDLISLLPMDLK